jgi:hypothetical protein
MQDLSSMECYLDCPFLDAKSRTCYLMGGKPRNIEAGAYDTVFLRTEYCSAFRKYVELLAEDIRKDQLAEAYGPTYRKDNNSE